MSVGTLERECVCDGIQSKWVKPVPHVEFIIQQLWCYLTHCWLILPLRVKPKMTIIVRLEFEIRYYDVRVHHVCHYPLGVPNLNLPSLLTLILTLTLTLGRAVQLGATGCAARLLGQLVEILTLGRAVQLGCWLWAM